MFRLGGFCLLFLWFCSFTAWGQEFKELNFPVFRGNNSLSEPFTGGWKCPQFSETDFNKDGITDIYVFDRVGNIHGAYLGEKKAAGRSEVAYVFSPQYVAHFPKAEGWVLLKDYDLDGISDFFAYSDIPGIDGIQVWKGFYTLDNKLSFRRLNFRAPYNILFFPLSVGGQTNLYVTRIDIPALDDIDGDGDLDIITFNINGGYAEWYRNESAEKNFKADSLLFRLEDQCWGGFYESGFSAKIDLSPAPGVCFKPTPSELAGNFRHSGSTILTLDLDNDGDKDLFLGDISFPNITLLTNGGTNKKAWMNKQDNYFPSYDFPVDIPVFPAAFALDINQDSLKDLIFAPNAVFNSLDEPAAVAYLNQGAGKNAQYKKEPHFSILKNAIDLGKGSSPTWVDVNADGRLDIVVGNTGNFVEPGKNPSGLFYFEHVGTPNAPSFVLRDSNFLDLNRYNSVTRDFSPTFGDLDNDGDVDVLIGDEMGKLFYGENKGGPGKPLSVPSFVYPYMNIDVGLRATPFIFDLNKDGLPDLIVGARGGNLNYFRNKGTKEKAFFADDPDEEPNLSRLGAVNTNKPGYFSGSSAPHFFQTPEGLKLLCGSEDKGLLLYDASESFNPYPLIPGGLSSLNIGFDSRPALADVNADGFYELLVGNARGGLQLFSTPWRRSLVSYNKPEPPKSRNIKIFPNPAHDFMSIVADAIVDIKVGKLTILDALGRTLLMQNDYRLGEELDISFLPKGIFFVRIEHDSRILQAPFVR
jgi:hypothetical protein